MVQRKTNPRMYITEVQKAFEADFYHRLVQSKPDEPQSALKGAIVREIVEAAATEAGTDDIDAISVADVDAAADRLGIEYRETDLGGGSQ